MSQKHLGLRFSEERAITEIPPTLPECRQTGPAVATAASSSVSSSSLDTQQTSDVFYPPKEWSADFTPPQKKVSEFVHAEWYADRVKIWRAFGRCKVSEERDYRFRHCGEEGWVYQNLDDLEKFKLVLNRCGDRFCQVCGRFRAAKLRAKVAANIGHGDLRLLTLTVQAKKQKLTEAISHLYQNFRLLRLTKIWQEKVKGGMAFLEIKWNEELKRWHPHLHVVMEGHYIEQGYVTQIWKALTGDSQIVDVRRIYNPETVNRYVTKYVTKPMNATFIDRPEKLDEAINALKGKRMAIPYGTWYAKKIEEMSDENVREKERDDPVWNPIGNFADILAKHAKGEERATYIIRKLSKFRTRSSKEDSS